MLVPKQLIDNYDIISPLGGGGGSNIYKALSKKTRSFVCLKQIFFDNESKKKHILREIDSMRKLNYLTNSIDFYEVISDKYYYYIIMELCDTSLRKLIEQKKGLEIPKIKVILNQLNKVFQKMKSLNMIHRDIKPENILIKYLDDKKKTFRIKLSDFGLSRELSHSGRASTREGTAGFMAPELDTTSDYYYDEKADIWSLGVTIYDMLYDELPFTSVKAMHQGKIPKLPKDKKLANLLKKMLRVDPEKRIGWIEYFKHPFFSDEGFLEDMNIEEFLEAAKKRTADSMEIDPLNIL